MAIKLPAWLQPILIAALGAAAPYVTNLVSMVPGSVKAALSGALLAVIAAELRLFLHVQPSAQVPNALPAPPSA